MRLVGVRAVAGIHGEQRDYERVLHARLLEGDPLAPVDLFYHFFGNLCRRLAIQYRATDRDLIEEAVSQTLLDYFTTPARYDPRKRTLRGYLVMSAQRDLQNILRSPRNRPIASREPTSVELDTQARRRWEMDGDIADEIADNEVARVLWERAMAVARTREERIVQSLWLDGERSTAIYAAALGWTDLPFGEQQKRLSRVKDRLDRRLRRRTGERNG
jgi:RNA polymerase sigma-70 factor (ECF subfamily)